MMINPILGREVVTIFRRMRTYFWITVYLGILIFVIFNSWPHYFNYKYANGSEIFGMITASRRAAAGIFMTMLALIMLMLPAYMATTFTREKEENTLASLAVTQLTIIDIVIGKVQVAIFYTFYLLVITLPIFGSMYNMGGFSLSEIFQCYFIIMVFSIAISLWSMFFSILSSTSYKSIARTYFFFILMLVSAGFISEAISARSTFSFFLDYAAINPFVCIETVFFGSRGTYYTAYSSRQVPAAPGNVPWYGTIYNETIMFTVFYSIVSAVFIVMIAYIYKKWQYKWM